MAGNILVLAENLNINNSSGSISRVALIENLACHYSVSVLHYSHNEIRLKDVNTILVKEDRKNWRFFMSRIIRLFRRYFRINLSPLFESLFGFSFTFMNDVYSYSKEIRKHELDTYKHIFTLSQGHNFITHKALLGIPVAFNAWIAYIHDPYPMKYYPTSYSYRSSGTNMKIKFMDKVFKSASSIAFPSLLLLNWMSQKYNCHKQKMIVIPHQISHRQPDLKSDTSSNYFNKTDFNIVHTGNLLGERSPITLIKAFCLVLDENNYPADLKLLFVGPLSPRWLHLKNNYKNHPNISFIEKIDFPEARYIQRESKVNVIIESNDIISPFLPGKFPHLIASKKPIIVIGPKDSEVLRLMPNSVLHAIHDDIDSIRKIILNLYNNPKYIFDELVNTQLIEYMSSQNLKKIMDGLDSK